MTEQVNNGSPQRGERSISQLVSDMSEQMSRLVRDEMRLATEELRTKGKRAGIGAGLAGAAGVTALLGAGTLVACVVLALALVLPAWAAALIVGAGLLLVAAVLGAFGGKQLKRATPPLPREAIAGIEQDVQVVKENARP